MNYLNEKFHHPKITNRQTFSKIILSLKLDDMLMLDEVENLHIIPRNILPNIDGEKIHSFVTDTKMKVAYSISIFDKIYNFHENEICSMHSIGKVFTGMLIIQLISKGIINEKQLKKPIELDKKVLNKLSPKVRNRLQKTTFLDVMTHNSGLKDYLPKYIDHVKNSINNDHNIPSPLEPEDFLIYADTNLSEQYEHYSNLGLLLVGLSAKYHYNLKYGNKLSYNEILNKYIIDKIELQSFNVTNPNQNPHRISSCLNGSPAGGYWITPNDLRKFGEWINKLCENKKTYELIKKYGAEFSIKKRDMIYHSGGLSTSDDRKDYSSAEFAVFLKQKIVISAMSKYGADASILYKSMFVFV